MRDVIIRFSNKLLFYWNAKTQKQRFVLSSLLFLLLCVLYYVWIWLPLEDLKFSEYKRYQKYNYFYDQIYESSIKTLQNKQAISPVIVSELKQLPIAPSIKSLTLANEKVSIQLKSLSADELLPFLQLIWTKYGLVVNSATIQMNQTELDADLQLNTLNNHQSL